MLDGTTVKNGKNNKLILTSIQEEIKCRIKAGNSTLTRPVENVVITTKGLQDRNIHILDGKTVENKDKQN